MAVIAVAGGGARALAWLLAVPGASRTLMDAAVPYSSRALEEYLGRGLDAAVSAETAISMARMAYWRALGLGSGSAPVAGIGCTATISTDRAKRGAHACFVAAWTDRGPTSYGVTFVKGLRDRAGEEDLVSRLLLRALADASGVEFDVSLPFDPREELDVGRGDTGDPLDELASGRVGSVTVRPDGSMLADQPHRGGVLSGSFYPLHKGHTDLADVAAGTLGRDVVFELSITNVDKPPLSPSEVKERLAQLAGGRSTIVTTAPTFHEKAGLLPGCTFVIGWDTAERLFDPRYYGDDEGRMMDALHDIRDRGCRFLVAGRADRGVFRSLDDVAIPKGLEGMMTSVAESEFRVDISSTGLRQGAGSL